jgi:hypothetical protein
MEGMQQGGHVWGVSSCIIHASLQQHPKSKVDATLNLVMLSFKHLP